MYFFLSIDTCFPNDRSPVVYTCCRWTARADEGDTAVKVVFNLLPLKDFLLCTQLISDLWGVDASTNFCIGLCLMLVWLYDYDCLLLRGLSLLIYESKF